MVYNCMSQVMETIDNIKFEKENIAIFGYSKFSIALAELLKSEYTIKKIIFLDNKIQDTNSIYEVKKPSDFLIREKYVVLLASSHVEQMSKQLDEIGLTKGKDYYEIINLEKWRNEVKRSYSHRYQEDRIILTQELHQILLDILIDVDTICRREGLHYFLDGGSLLGAVRHGGFIPWDHDLDVMMPIDDAFKLGEIITKQYSDKYCFQYFDTDDEYLWLHPRIAKKGTHALIQAEGNVLYESPIYFDLDIWSGYGDTLEDANKHWKYQRDIWDSWFQKIVISDQKQYKKNQIMMVRQMQFKYDFFSSQYVGKVYGLSCDKYHNKDIVLPPSMVQFENINVYSYAKVDSFLSFIYGDYMQLPPMEKRIGSKDVWYQDEEKI